MPSSAQRLSNSCAPVAGRRRRPPANRWCRRVQLVHVGHDDTGIDSEPFPADQPFTDTARDDAFEDQAEQIAIAELPVSLLREGRVVRDLAIEAKPTEPPVSQVEVNLVEEPAFGADPGPIADQQHPHDQFGIEGRPRWL